MSGDWQQFRSGAEVPSLSFTARRRGIQRELPSTLTNGQKDGRMFQRKMFHPFFTFFEGQRRNLAGTMIRPVSAGAEGQRGLLKTLHYSVHAQPDGLVS